MIEKFFKELENRRSTVEKFDFDIQTKNRDYFRNLWLYMIILSSAIAIGILPIMAGPSTIIRSLVLAKLGLIIIMIVCVWVVFYFLNVLFREKVLLFEQAQFHKNTFSEQLKLLEQVKKEGKNEKEIEIIFYKSKSNAYIQEQKIIARHLIGGKFVKVRLFIDKYFNQSISYGFALGILLVILSFMLRI